MALGRTSGKVCPGALLGGSCEHMSDEFIAVTVLVTKRSSTRDVFPSSLVLTHDCLHSTVLAKYIRHSRTGPRSSQLARDVRESEAGTALTSNTQVKHTRLARPLTQRPYET